MKRVFGRLPSGRQREGDEEKDSGLPGPAFLADNARRARLSRLTSSFVDYPRHGHQPGDVTNKAAAMAAIDRLLGFDGPPALEYIVVEETQGGIPGVPWLPIGFGHAVLRYRLPSGEERIANITKSGRLCEFWESPADYLLGSQGGRHGIFARQMYSIRVQEWDDSSIKAMHHFLCAINASKDAIANGAVHRRETARFDLTGALTAFVGHLGGAKVVAAGNCSNWTSRALHMAGLVDRPHTLPKAVFIDMFEELVLRKNLPCAKVVLYRQAEAGKLSPTATDPSQRCTPRRFDVVHGMCSPLMYLRQPTFWDITPFADAEVTVDDSGIFGAVATGGSLSLCEGEPEGGVGKLKVQQRAGTQADGEALAAAAKRLEAAKRAVVARVSPGPAHRPRWYLHGLRWKLHSVSIGLCVALQLMAGYPRHDTPWSAFVARALLCLLGLVINAAFA
eukprot:CAMPEP_0117687576 /NCGR_PEP_ID=MMETSP0804-20121206/23221_1 /TAXON_ID=1074897 /ORGANISM="Tetraselmis astigmatica, Strain CCMP880" /LENGTH=448 /DNA_ID=CAMNT_0005499673 /DNA_START=162 /DNA_END=1508 /DNA_ORIENTATION=+